MPNTTRIMFIKSLLFYILLIVWTAAWVLTIIGPSLILPLKKRHLFFVYPWCYISIHLLRIICNVNWTIHGKNNLPNSATILVSNHQSAWETIFLQTIMTPQSQVVKKELLKIPFFGWGLKATAAIAIDRKKSISSINILKTQGEILLNQGINILIFPEGTRASPRNIGKFSHGMAHLAIKAKATITPIAHNSGTCWPSNRFIIYPGNIDVFIGTPINITETSTDAAAITAQVSQWIESTLHLSPEKLTN